MVLEMRRGKKIKGSEFGTRSLECFGPASVYTSSMWVNTTGNECLEIIVSRGIVMVFAMNKTLLPEKNTNALLRSNFRYAM
jgi:hypothetical protein